MFGTVLGGHPFSSMYGFLETCKPLMKKTNAGEIEDIVRVETGMVLSERLTSQMFYDWINWACDEIKEKRGLRRKYVCFRSLGVGTSFDLSNISMREILKITDSSAGLVRLLGADEYERVGSFSSYDNSAFATQEGETLKITYGSGVTPGGVTLYYFRHIIPVRNSFDYPDLPDNNKEVLVKEVKHYVLEFLNDF